MFAYFCCREICRIVFGFINIFYYTLKIYINNLNLLFLLKILLTLFRFSGGAKKVAYQFFPCNFYKHRSKPKNFLNFSFNPFVTLVYNFKLVPSANPELLNLYNYHPSKKAVFVVKSYQTLVT